MHCTPTTAIQSDKPSTKHKDGISEKSWNHPKITRSHIHWVASPALLYLLSHADTFKSLDGHSGACTNHSDIPAEVTLCYLELHLQSFFSWTPLKTNQPTIRGGNGKLLAPLPFLKKIRTLIQSSDCGFFLPEHLQCKWCCGLLQTQLLGMSRASQAHRQKLIILVI